MTSNANKNITALVTCDQFKALLRENFQGFDELLSFSAVRALDDGENYITTIIRICADMRLKDASEQQVQFILKIPLQLKQNKECEEKEQQGQRESTGVDDYHELFVTEVDMYDNIVPELEELYAKMGILVQFKAKKYKFAHKMSCNYVLMEDLQLRGFETARRREGLDVVHTTAVLAKLAQWHAASAKRIEIKGAYPKEYVESYFSQTHLEFIEKMNAAFNEPFIQCMESYDLMVREKEIILNYMRNMNELYLKFGSVDAQAFNVLNHGDFWINNIMFQHDDDDRAIIKEVLFVDFQLPKYGTFAMDLFCFLMTSPQWFIRLRNFDNFVQYYYLELIKNLKVLQYKKPMPTLKELHTQLEKYGLWAFVCVQRMLAVALLDPQENSNIETFMSNNEEGKAFKKRMFYNPQYVSQVKEILPWLIEKNYLHCLTQIIYERRAKMSAKEEINHKNGTLGSIPSEKTSDATNGDGPTVPDWLKAELFNDFLKENIPEFKEIKNFKIKPAVAPGENYTTLMLQIEIEIYTQSGKQKTLSYMMKLPIDSLKDLMENYDVFGIESTMYCSVVPEMEQMYRDAGVEVKFGARYYDIRPPTEAAIILLEDLRQRGFKNVNRLQGLDMEHTKCMLRKLAQWHAASATRVQFKGPYPKAITIGFFLEEYYESTKQMYENLGKAFMNSARTLQGNEEYIETLEKFNLDQFARLFKASKFDPNEFNVLNHGDCWSNNVMFQYDAFGKIKETYFVDYQLPKYGSPAQDLYYALLSSTSFELKVKQFDYFIKFYHDNLVENLTLLKYPKQIPKLRDLHTLLHKHNIWAYATTSGVMAAVLLDPTDKAKLESMIEESEAGDDFKKQLFAGARFRKHAEVVLPWLHNRGVLEC
ncbi:uncharacterized protein LOC128856061 [Anastrepha ludens]|uniref:uncharacterized protein LOC128856061 n=1 Tax=Anastrepha ludens TaxID=28586 RepID=UPI0023B0AB01|nr:uncharacterized protein LOC128856061 [Anastrepha ludens]